MTEVSAKDATGTTSFDPPVSSIPIASQPQRVTSVDLVRGVVMILMALDHTRDYFSSLRFQPEDLSKATPFLFFTRWITHFCAPTFVLLAGVGAALSMSRGKSKRQMITGCLLCPEPRHRSPECFASPTAKESRSRWKSGR